MACCEYRIKEEDSIPKEIAYILLILISILLFFSMCFFGVLGLISTKSEKIADFLWWSLISLSDSPEFYLSDLKIKLSASLFSFSPFFAGWIYKSLNIFILFIIDFTVLISILYLIIN